MSMTFLHLLHIWALIEYIQTAPINKKHFSQAVLGEAEGSNSLLQAHPGESFNGLLRPLCKENEFYDGVVQKCALCSDVCYENMDDKSFCSNNCPGFYRDHFMKSQDLQNTPPNRSPIAPQPGHPIALPGHVIRSPEGSTPSPPVGSERFLDQPLFWTSIISLVISTCSTVIIIVLCVRKVHSLREMRRARRPLIVRRRNPEGRSVSGELDGDRGSDSEAKGKLSESNKVFGNDLRNGQLNSALLLHKSTDTGNQTRKQNGHPLQALANQLHSGQQASPGPRQGEEHSTGGPSLPSQPVLRVLLDDRSCLIDKAPSHGNDQKRNQPSVVSFKSSLTYGARLPEEAAPAGTKVSDSVSRERCVLTSLHTPSKHSGSVSAEYKKLEQLHNNLNNLMVTQSSIGAKTKYGISSRQCTTDQESIFENPSTELKCYISNNSIKDRRSINSMSPSLNGLLVDMRHQRDYLKLLQDVGVKSSQPSIELTSARFSELPYIESI